MTPHVELLKDKIEAFCHTWKVVELALFGSVLRDDFGPDSDVDVLVTFADDARWGLLDHARMERELAAIIGRDVDLVTRSAVERSPNWIRRREILEGSRSLYAAR